MVTTGGRKAPKAATVTRPCRRQRSDVHQILKGLSKKIRDEGGISKAKDVCEQVGFSGLEKQWKTFQEKISDPVSPPQTFQTFIESLDWEELGTSPSPVNSFLICSFVLPFLKDFPVALREDQLEEKKRTYRERYKRAPVECYDMLYLLDRYVGNIAAKNKVAFQAVACVIDGILYEKISSKKPSERQCRHFVAIEHIGDMEAGSNSMVARVARENELRLATKLPKLTAREALRRRINDMDTVGSPSGFCESLVRAS